MKREDWYKLDEEAYARLFSESAVKRAKFSGLMRNLAFIADKNLENSGKA
jgi:epoxyqueuosine reductase